MQTRIVVLGDAWDLLKFLNDDEFALDEKAAAKELRRRCGPGARRRARRARGVAEWTTAQDRDCAQGRADRRTWRSSRAKRSARSGSPPPARRSARRCSSRWSCSAATAACTGCARAATARPRRGRRVKERREIFGSLHVGPTTAGSGGPPTACQVRKMPVTSGYRQPMGYGVIGNTAVSGSAILGSSPGTPATLATHERLGRHRLAELCWQLGSVLAPSSSGLGRRPLTAVAWVRIPSGLPTVLRGRRNSRFAGLFASACRGRRRSEPSGEASAAASRSAAHRAPGRRPIRSIGPDTETAAITAPAAVAHRRRDTRHPGSRSAALCAQPRLRTSASVRSVNFAVGSTACCVAASL